jgi:signal transduction histidine kinase
MGEHTAALLRLANTTARLRGWRSRPALPPLSATRFLQSAGVRFGVIYAALFSISAIALAAFLWWSTAGLLERQTDAAIESDSVGLSERFAEGGPKALVETINERVLGNVDDDALYLLVDPSFQRVAGNLGAWPQHMAMDEDWDELRIERAGVMGLARVHYFELPGGFHLLIGRDVEVRSRLRVMMADAMFWAAVIALVLGTVGAWAVRGLFGSMIADVSATAMAVSAGDFTRRVKVGGHEDEFDLLAETINDMLDRIGTLMDGVRQVSNAIAHDLRTPITRARTRLEDAAIHARTEAELRAAIDRAMVDLDGVVGVFQALLRIAEIEAGARRSAFTAFDLAPVLTDLAELYDVVAEEKGVHLRASIPAELPAFGDRDMVQQAVANLLDNAVKFSPDGTVVSLAARALGGHLEIVVADQGPGIPPEDRPRASERFFRGEQARSTPGSGLGLSLVQAVAQLHGGRLDLGDAEPGLRATLTLATRAALEGPTPA